jgi:hypothetical protein
MNRFSLAFAVVLTCASTFVQAQTPQDVDARMDALFGSHQPYRDFFDQFKQAVAKGDRNAVAAMIAYPVAIHNAGKTSKLRTKREFLALYDRIFTPKLVDVVAKQEYGALFVRDQGAMIGDGEIWFGGVCRDKGCKQSEVRVTGFNLG